MGVCGAAAFELADAYLTMYGFPPIPEVVQKFAAKIEPLLHDIKQSKPFEKFSQMCEKAEPAWQGVKNAFTDAGNACKKCWNNVFGGKGTANVVTEAAKDFWDMPESGKIINGRYYTKHALERMAPNTREVREELAKRALGKGKIFGTREFFKEIDPRNIPPLVVEDAIQHGAKTVGDMPKTWQFEGPSVRVIVNDEGNVVTVIPKSNSL